MEDKLPLHLGVKPCVIATAIKNHPNDCERALHEVLDRWLKGGRSTGGEDRTWGSVLSFGEEQEGRASRACNLCDRVIQSASI